MIPEDAYVRINVVSEAYKNTDPAWFLSELGMIIDIYCHENGLDPVEATRQLHEVCKDVNDKLGAKGAVRVWNWRED